MLKTLLIIGVYSLFSTGFVHAENAQDEIAQLVALTEKPSGVVFEIVSGDAESLRWAIPRVKHYINRLRDKFPGIDIAIVTHGNEQFALQKSNRKNFQKVHSLVESLGNDDNVPVHVCGTFASWRDIAPEEFPAYVDVAPAGPAQINNYKELGFIVVKLAGP